MPTGSYQLITLVQGRQFRSTNDKILLPQAQIKSVRDRVVRRGLFQNFQGDLEFEFFVWCLKEARRITRSELSNLGPFNLH